MKSRTENKALGHTAGGQIIIIFDTVVNAASVRNSLAYIGLIMPNCVYHFPHIKPDIMRHYFMNFIDIRPCLTASVHRRPACDVYRYIK